MEQVNAHTAEYLRDNMLASLANTLSEDEFLFLVRSLREFEDKVLLDHKAYQQAS